MVIHIDELIKSDNCGFEVFERQKEMAKAIFDVSHPQYSCRTKIELHRYPYTYYEVIDYIRPMTDYIDVYESVDGTNWYKTN
jgi:hypothetical protein